MMNNHLLSTSELMGISVSVTLLVGEEGKREYGLLIVDLLADLEILFAITLNRVR